MPSATRFSPSYARRRSSSDDQEAPSVSSKPKSHSMAYLRSRLSSSLHSQHEPAAPAVGVASESYLRVKKKGALATWSTRYLVLRGAQLVWFQSKQDAQWRRGVQEIAYVARGNVATLRSHELGLEFATTDGKEFVARTFDRADLAKWITAFHRLALKNEAKLEAAGRLSETLTADSSATGDLRESELEQRRKSRMESAHDKSAAGRHVSFHKSVLVRTIPAVADDLLADLYYTKEDMERFSSRASSILSRTEEAVSCAYQAIRRPVSLCCRRDVSCLRTQAV